MSVIKWQLNFVSCNFGVGSYLGFLIKLALRALSIFKSSQIALHSVQLALLIA